MDLVVPQLVARVIDEGIIARDAARLGLLVGLVAGMVLVRGLTLFGHRAALRWYESNIGHRLRQDMYDHLQRLPYSYYDRVDSGDVITRAISDVNAVRAFAGVRIMDIIRVLGLYAVIAAGMAMTSPELTWLALVVLAVMGALATFYGRVVRPLWLALQQQTASLTKRLSENLNGIRVVKAFAEEEAEIASFRREAVRLRARSLRPAQVRARFIPAMLLLTGLGTVLVLWVGGRMAIEGVLSVGVLVAFYYYFARLLGPTRQLGFIIQGISRAVASGERVFGLLDEPVRIASKPDAKTPDRMRGEVRFADVTMGYRRNQPVLRGVEAAIPAGSVVGVVGPTGSGKTTLAQLIPRFYDVTEGAVRVDGTDLRDHDLQKLRGQTAMVPQDAFLFSDSVRNNIAYGDPEASVERVVAAAKDAQAYNFIAELPEGFETVVGERGVGLSGGQRQRLTIARALLLDAPILILDDATSSVDTETERRLQQALRSHLRGRTTFIISQRCSSVQDADEILVVEDGRITDRGTHAELVQRPGFYRELFELQTQQASQMQADLQRAKSPRSAKRE